MFKSTNGGGTWASASTGLPTFGAVGALAIEPLNSGIVYAASFSNGIFKTVNGGGNWVDINAGVMNEDITALAVDPLQPSTIYAGDDRGGVNKSSNGGATWSLVNVAPRSVKALLVEWNDVRCDRRRGNFQNEGWRHNVGASKYWIARLCICELIDNKHRPYWK